MSNDSGGGRSPPERKVGDSGAGVVPLTVTTPELRRTSFLLSPEGTLLDGDAPPDLIDSVAYAALLAGTAGELIGVQPLVCFELVLSNGVCVVGREPGGNLVAMTGPPRTSVAELKRAMGL